MRFYLFSIPGDCTLYKPDTDYKALLKRDEFGTTLIKFSIHRCLFARLSDEYAFLFFQIAFLTLQVHSFTIPYQIIFGWQVIRGESLFNAKFSLVITCNMYECQ